MDKSKFRVVPTVRADASLAQVNLDVSRRLVDPHLNAMIDELVYPLQPVGILRGVVVHADARLELLRTVECRERPELGRLAISDVIAELEQIESLQQSATLAIDRVQAVARKGSKLISLVGLISPYSMEEVDTEHQAVVSSIAALADIPAESVQWNPPSAAVKLLSIQSCHSGAVGGVMQKNLMRLPELLFEPVQL